MNAQLSFNFDAPPAVNPPARATAPTREEQARAHWKTGMVTSLPLFASVQDIGKRYTQMLPGVIESIDGDLAAVRIYAAPEWGCTLEAYPLHLALAIDVPLVELGVYHWNTELQQVVDAGLLTTGDAELGARVRARMAQGVAA